jgi:hypothetical protein
MHPRDMPDLPWTHGVMASWRHGVMPAAAHSTDSVAMALTVSAPPKGMLCLGELHTLRQGPAFHAAEAYNSGKPIV